MKSFKYFLNSHTAISRPAYQKIQSDHYRYRKGERGNVFFTLFGAVAVVGVLGAGIMATMRGPLSTMVEVNLRERAKIEMGIAAKLVMLESTDQANSGDCDSDGFVEPIGYSTNIASLTGGGELPVGGKQDPWGNDYGYCAWDAGTASSDGGCTGDYTNLLDGDAPTGDADYSVIAIISAGSDGTFQTTCADHATLVTPGGDDLVEEYSYEYAAESTGGLWNIKAGDPGIAEIAKNLEVTGGASFSETVALGASAQLQLGASSLLLPDQVAVATCNSANDQILRRNTSLGYTYIEICDDTASTGTNNWVSVAAAGSLWSSGTDNDIFYNTGTPQVGIGMTAPDDTLDIVGTFDLSSTAAIGGLLTAEAGLTVSAGTTTLGVTNISGATTITNTLAVTNDVTITGSANSGTGDSLTVNNSDSSVVFVVQHDGSVGIGRTNPSEELDVSGDIVVSGSYMIDGYRVVSSPNTTNDTNIFLGNNAGNAGITSTVDGNTVVGGGAATGIDGADNTIIGAGAGATLTTGTNNILIGEGIDVPLNTTSNYLNIGGVITADLSGGRVTLTEDLIISGDDLFMNTNTDTAILVADGTNFNPVVPSGDISITNDGTITIKDGSVEESMLNMSNGATGGDCLKYLSGNLTWESCSSSGGGDGLGGNGLPEVLAEDNSANSLKITSLADPTADQDAATKKYVDDQLGSLSSDRIQDEENDTYIDVDTTNDGETNSIVMYTNSSERLSISSAGVTAITGSATISSTLAVTDDAAFDTNTLYVDASENNVGMGTTTPNASAILDLTSTSLGFLPPRVNTPSSAISAATTGLIAYDADSNTLQYYNGSSWITLESVDSATLSIDDLTDAAHDPSSSGNMFLGQESPNSLTTGTNNFSIGSTALDAVTSGANNIAIGPNAATELTTGNNNVFLGYQAGDAMETGSNNIVLGYDIDASSAAASNELNIGGTIFGKTDAGRIGLGVTDATAIDASAILDLTSTSLGFLPPRVNTPSSAISAAADGLIAYDADTDTLQYYNGTDWISLESADSATLGIDDLTDAAYNTTTTYNMYLGQETPIALTTGTYNTAIGIDTLFANTTGDNNVALGYNALKNNKYINTVAIGYNAGLGTGSGTAARNVFVGTEAGNGIGAGDDNVFIGYRTGRTTDGGQDNIIIGSELYTSGPSASNQLNIGGTIFGKTDTGRIGLGVTDATAIDASAILDLTSTSLGFLPPRVNTPSSAISAAADGLIAYDADTDTLQYFNGTSWISLESADSISLAIDDLTDAETDYTTDYNMFLGDGAGANGITGAKYNLAIGQKTLAGVKTNAADNNLAIGYNALNGITSGFGNIGIGLNAGAGLSNHDGLMAIGVNAFKLNKPYRGSMAIGYDAASNIGTQFTDFSVAIGYNAAEDYNNGKHVTIVGGGAGKAASGNDNTFIGFDAGRLVAGNSSTAIGAEAARNITGKENVSVGAQALSGVYTVSTGAQNTAIGTSAGTAITTGDNNIFLGYQAGDATTEGSDNILIGYDIDASSATASNELNIGGTIFGKTDTGRIGLGVTDATAIDASAILDLTSTSLGFLPPRVNTPSSAISAAADGLIAYDADTDTLQYYNGTDWQTLASSDAVPDRIQDSDNNTYIDTDTDGDHVIRFEPGYRTTAPTFNDERAMLFRETVGGHATIMQLSTTSSGRTSGIRIVSANGTQVGQFGANANETSIIASNGSNSADISLTAQDYIYFQPKGTERVRFTDNGATITNGTIADPNASAVLDLTSTSLGFLPPRMNTPSTAITGEIAGLMAYDSGTNTLQYFNGTDWKTLAASGSTDDGDWLLEDGVDVSTDLSVGIGTTSPDASAALDITSTTQGFLPPRNTDPASNIASAAEGLFAYDSTDKVLQYKNDTRWVDIRDDRITNSVTGTFARAYQGYFMVGVNGDSDTMELIRTSTGNHSTYLKLRNTSSSAEIGVQFRAANDNFNASVVYDDGATGGLEIWDRRKNTIKFQTESPATERARITSTGMSIGSAADPDASAILDLTSTSLGFLPPRMNSPSDSISSAADGLMAYDTGTDTLQYYNGTEWKTLSDGSITNDSIDWAQISDSMTLDEDTVIDMDTNNKDITFDDDSNTLHIDSENNRVGIGTNQPATPFEIEGTDFDIQMGYSRGNPLTFGNIGTSNKGSNITWREAGEGSDQIASLRSYRGYSSAASNMHLQVFDGSATNASSILMRTGKEYDISFATEDTTRMLLNAGGLEIGDNADGPDASAILDLTSTSLGFLPPRMNTPSTAITGEIAGLMAYDSGTNTLQYFNGTDWVSIGGGIDDNSIDWAQISNSMTLDEDTVIDMDTNNKDITFDDDSNTLHIDSENNRIGIGTNTPSARLHINGTPGSLTEGIVFGDGDSGIYEAADDTLSYTLAGATRWYMNTSAIWSQTGTGPKIQASGSSAIMYTRYTDPNTGLGTLSGSPADKLALYTGGTAALVIDDAHSVGIGTSVIDASAILDLTSTSLGFLPPRMNTPSTAIASETAGLMAFNTGTSDMEFYDGSSWRSMDAGAASSDERLKENIKALNDNTLEKVLALRTVKYDWKDKQRGTDRQIGVIAQDVQKSFPELVSTDGQGYLQVDYRKLSVPLIKSVHDLKAANDNLRDEVAALKSQQSDILKEVNALKIHTGYSTQKAMFGMVSTILTLLAIIGAGFAFFFRKRKKSGA